MFEISAVMLMKTSEHTCETRKRLLESAGEVFAERGFHSATIREICDHAGANVAAINYHFGDKQALYAEVFNEWTRVAMQKYPPTFGLGDHPSLEERLHAFVRSFLHRLTDDGRPSWRGKLISREMFEPTGVLDQVIDKNYRPTRELLDAIVRGLLGADATDDQIRMHSASVIGQCLYYHFARPVIERLDPEQKFDPQAIDSLAVHITRFSLDALRAANPSTRTTVTS